MVRSSVRLIDAVHFRHLSLQLSEHPVELDNVDRGILHELQYEARNRTAKEIADRVAMSASTVRNRITELEDDGITDESITNGQPLSPWT